MIMMIQQLPFPLSFLESYCFLQVKKRHFSANLLVFLTFFPRIDLSLSTPLACASTHANHVLMIVVSRFCAPAPVKRIFGPELIRINKSINALIKTARSAVFKKLRGALFLFRRQPQFFENLTLVARQRERFRGFGRFFWLLNSLQKRIFKYTSIHSLLVNGVITASSHAL